MEQTGGSNKHLNENSGSGRYHHQNSNQVHIYSNDEIWRSSDNLNLPHTEMNRKMKVHNEEEEDGSEGELIRKGSTSSTHHRLPTSASASPHLGGVPLSSLGASNASIPLHNELHSSLPEGHLSCLGLNVDVSPTHITISTPMENGDNRSMLQANYSQSPRLSPRTMHGQAASGESSDERGADKLDRSRISTSREGSFERSVSFQEASLDQDKSNEATRHSDSNRSLDSFRPADSSMTHSSSHASSGGAKDKDKDRERKESRESKAGAEKDKKSKKSWYNVLSPTYKSRSEDLKRLFKDLPSEERLIVDYSCALQKDILVHGRLYVTPNYFSFYSKIFGWETFLSIKCKDIVAMTKEKTALVIPNALQVNTETDKHFFTSFAARDKTYLMLFRIWQNALMDQLPLANHSKMRRMYSNPNSPQMSATELWHWVHSSYGEELGLTSDDDDYVAPSTEEDMKSSCCSMTEHPAGAEAKRNSGDSAEDVSQGESYVEEGHHSSSKPPGDEARVDAPNSSSKSSFNSSSKCSGASSSFGISPSTYKSSPRKGEKDNPHELPTDLSDSVESDPDKEKIPCSVTEVVTCPTVSTHHVGREVSNTVYGLPIDTLFTLLFTNSKFMLDLHTARKTYDLVPSSWQSNAETNQKIRQVTYTLTLPTNSFGPKVSHVTETQVISSFSKSSEIYAIDAEASNSGIPYADSFYVSNHWCLTRESANETRLALWSQVKYKKNVWGFMKNVIDKNAFSGMESLMSDLNASLLLEVDRANVKRTRRRRRRLGSKDSEIGDSLIQLPPPGIAITDIHKATQISSRKLTFPSVSIEPASPQVKSSVKTVGLMFLCLLLAVNAFLYYRLYDLEERVVNNVSFKSLGLDSSIFKFKGPSNKEGLSDDWVQVLQKQEALHIEELERWRKAVMEATNYLRLAEESLRKLHDSIPIQQASKMQHLLQQLQVLQEMQEEQHQGKGAPPISESPPPPPKEKGPLKQKTAEDL